MKPAPQREEALFQAAVQLTGGERATFLNGACLGDPALRERLEALLAAHEQPDDLLATPGFRRDELHESPIQGQGLTEFGPPGQHAPRPTIKLDLVDAPDEAVGQTLGRYKLLERVGEGGCGVVYVAEQTEPVRRRVALKVIKLGMDTKQVVARFEAERQALAMMDHPNIAKVLDAGTTETGRPFFVMELVRGIRITDYCDEASLSTQERLELFIKVCQAIQHAHQKGIIHRDIKPSNILVTLHDGVPVPKVIDFGIAKATEGRLTDNTVYTQLHQFIGTPAYMSPEQAEMSGLDIDTRSDIYSLGVLLYELLAGSTPFDAKELMASGIDAMRKTIREKEPMRPSTRLATLKSEELTTTAKRRSAEAPKLIHLLRGDLDWIVMKCLEKDRTRRYETANGLAADLKRHLSNEPVVARPPSMGYRLEKSFRRNKLAFTAAGVVGLALALGVVVSAWQAVRATRAEREQSHLREDAEKARSSEAIERQKAERESKRAEAGELTARRIAYASDMNLAQQGLADNNLGRAQELLNRHRPLPPTVDSQPAIDLRGWEWRYLWQQCQSDAQSTLCQKPSEITSLAVSSDGNWLAVAEYEKGGLSIWDLRTRQELTRLEAGEGVVLAEFSPREPLLAFSVVRDPTQNRRDSVHLWNGVTRQIVTKLQIRGAVRGLKFSSDGQTLITSTVNDNQIELWRIPDGKKLASIPAPQTWDDDANLLAVSRDMSMAAHGLEGGRIRVVDLSTGRERWMAKAVDAHSTALEFSPDGQILATGAGYVDSSVRLWEAATGKEIGRLEGHRGYVHSLVFWPDGNTLASASSDQTICLWDLRDRTRVPPPRTLRGHKREVWRLALLPDNATLISGSQDGLVNFWNTALTLRQTAHFTLPPSRSILERAWRFSPDHQSMLSVDSEGRVQQWQGLEFQRVETLLELGSQVQEARISDDARLVASGSPDGIVRVWDLPHRKLLREFATEPGPVSPWQFLMQGRRLLLYHPQTGNFSEWDLTNWRRTRSLPRVNSPDWAWSSGDNRWFFSGAGDNPAILNDTEPDPITQRKLDVEQVSAAALSPDGMLVAASSRAGYARVWETTTLREVVTFRNFLQGVHGLAFSADGRRLVTASDGREAIKLWDVESQQELLTLSASGSRFRRIACSPDGNILFAMNDQGGVHLWRAPSWGEIEAAEAKVKAEIKQP